MDQLNQEFFFEILEKFEAGKATPEEVRFLDAYYQSFGLKENLSSKLNDEQKQLLKNEIYNELIKETVEFNQPRIVRISGRQLLSRIAVAASVIFLICAIFFYYNYKPAANKRQFVLNDIRPGDNKAILTLANGEQIVLTDAGNGKIAKENNTIINKTADGELIYINKGTKSLAYNTVSTPRGGQYTLTLSDGTKVFLNAASSLKYPVAFTDKERRVELTGEAYFEVARNAAKPFKVTSGDQVVEVLGTHFNINGYSDEPIIKTTLIEGSVRIYAGKQALMLAAGQQSLTISDGRGNLKILLNKDADIASDIAWRNGLFQFNNASIREVMKDAARWYDVDVTYENDLPAVKVTGQISRKVNLSGLLELMEFAGARIKIEGRHVTILK